jgi:tetratricopeptide (TPR) repeat protein
MHQYGVREVEKMLRLPRSTIRSLVDAGFVSPARGPRNALLFSFQDLIVLRTAQALAAAKISPKRMTRSLKELRRQLPDSMPLSGFSIGAVGERVVVRDGAGQRQVESGQYLLAFEGDPVVGRLSVIEPEPLPAPPPVDWYAQALMLEEKDRDGALAAYARALEANPQHLEACINYGRLLHEAARLPQAERVYRRTLKDCGEDPLLLFNLAVLLEDLRRDAEAVGAYEAALKLDAAFADCHYNLAVLSQKLGKPRDAIRHFSQYRRLTAAS